LPNETTEAASLQFACKDLLQPILEITVPPRQHRGRHVKDQVEGPNTGTLLFAFDFRSPDEGPGLPPID
jgi:hypothetical protein